MLEHTVYELAGAARTDRIRVSDADRQILFGLVAIRLKLVSLAQVSRRWRIGRRTASNRWPGS